jgi:hypothetical protein
MARATKWRNSGELVTAMLAVRASDVDGDVKGVVARTANRLSQDPSAYGSLLRCASVGYLVGRSSLDARHDRVLPDPDGGATAERARVLVGRLATYHLSALASALGAAAQEVLDGFVAMSAQASTGDGQPGTTELRKAAIVGLGVAVAEAELADPGTTTDV